MIRKTFKLFMSIIPFFVLFWCLYTFPTILQSYNQFKQTYTPNNFIHISDNFDSEYDSIINRNGIEQDLWEINQFLHNSDFFTFGESFFSPIFIYSNDTEISADALHIDNQAWDLFSLSIQSGREFSESDFMLTDQSPNTSIIMGSDFKSKYKIGDKLSLYSTGNQFIGEVCGFLTENSEIIMYNKPISLTSSIILPNKDYSTLFETDNSNNKSIYPESFLKSIKYDLLSRNNGVYISDHTKKEISDLINEEYAEYELPTISLSAKYDDLNLFFIISISILVFLTFASLCCSIVIIIRKHHLYHSKNKS